MRLRRLLIQLSVASVLLPIFCGNTSVKASDEGLDPGTVIAEADVGDADLIVTIPDTNGDQLITWINLPTKIRNNSKIQKLILPKAIEGILGDEYYETDTALVQDYSSLTPNCPNLEWIEIDEDNLLYTSKDGVLYSKDMTILYYCPPGKKGELIIPEGVTEIGFMAFQECEKLTMVQLPSTLTRVREAAFGGNTSLTKLTVSKKNQMFKTVSNVLFSKNGEQLVAYAGGKTNKSYTIPEGVKVISNAAFMGCTNITQLITEDNMTTVGVEAFRDCSNLQKVRFADGLRDLYAGAFLNCSNLAELNLPDGTRSICEEAIKGCNKLLDITLPQSLQEIDCEISNVPNRTIRMVTPYLGAGLNYMDIAKGVTVYVYQDSFLAPTLLKNGVKTVYFEDPYHTVSAAAKAPGSAVKGTGKADSTWYNKTNKVFYIKNPDQLAGLAKLVKKGVSFKGKKIVLTKDLDLSCYPNWQPIGGEDDEFYKFAGDFDGKNHVIYHLRINRMDGISQGLFGVTSGEIKNLTITDADILGNTNIGILCGRNDGTISNCKVSGAVHGFENVGGLVGQCSRNVSKCSVNVEVFGIKNAGGITGTNYQDITGCTNFGSVTGYDSVGGFSGRSYNGTIRDSENNMTIKGDINVGGFLGTISWDALVINCTNKTNVSGNEKVGGIAGDFYFQGAIENCVNEGMVSGTYYVGGIAGYLAVGSLKNCINKGEVYGEYGVAGVLGMLGSVYPVYDRVVGCANEGMLDGIIYSADIIGKDTRIPDVYGMLGDN